MTSISRRSVLAAGASALALGAYGPGLRPGPAEAALQQRLHRNRPAGGGL